MESWLEYDSIINVNIYNNKESKEDISSIIDEYIDFVDGEFTGISAVVCIYENENVIQFCGGNGFFRLETIELYDEIPIIYLLGYKHGDNIEDIHSYKYDDNIIEESIGDLVSKKLLSTILKYSFTNYKLGDWEKHIKELCDKFSLSKETVFLYKFDD